MDGLAQALGRRERSITVGGKPYTLSSPRLGDWLALEVALAGTLPDPVEAAARAAERVPADQREMFWREAYRAAREARKINLQNLDELPTMMGIAAQAFVALRARHPGEAATLGGALDWLDRAAAEHGMDAVAAMLAALLDPAAAGAHAKKADPTPSTGPD